MYKNSAPFFLYSVVIICLEQMSWFPVHEAQFMTHDCQSIQTQIFRITLKKQIKTSKHDKSDGIKVPKHIFLSNHRKTHDWSLDTVLIDELKHEIASFLPKKKKAEKTTMDSVP